MCIVLEVLYWYTRILYWKYCINIHGALSVLYNIQCTFWYRGKCRDEGTMLYIRKWGMGQHRKWTMVIWALLESGAGGTTLSYYLILMVALSVFQYFRALFLPDIYIDMRTTMVWKYILIRNQNAALANMLICSRIMWIIELLKISHTEDTQSLGLYGW